MEKNWYVVYTRPLLQKRVASLCKRKKIDCYIPFCRKEDEFRKGRENSELLFLSYMFIKTDSATLRNVVMKHDAVLSVMHWHDQPVKVKEEEIDALRHFTQEYANIRLEHLKVNPGGSVKSQTRAVKEVEGNVYSLSCKTIKVSLPSLGCALVADINIQVPETEKFIFSSELLQQYQ